MCIMLAFVVIFLNPKMERFDFSITFSKRPLPNVMEINRIDQRQPRQLKQIQCIIVNNPINTPDQMNKIKR